jgi:hypothetical protein
MVCSLIRAWCVNYIITLIWIALLVFLNSWPINAIGKLTQPVVKRRAIVENFHFSKTFVAKPSVNKDEQLALSNVLLARKRFNGKME